MVVYNGINMKTDELRDYVKGHEIEVTLPETSKYTSVLIPVFERDGVLQVLFEVRSSKIAHAGEISFPGGYVEKGETSKEAALRETSEELLIKEEQVEVLAPMHRCANRGNLIIDSYLGILYDYNLTYNEEVEEVFSVPLQELLDYKPGIYSLDLYSKPNDSFPYELIPGGKDYPFFVSPRPMYFYIFDDKVIWGLTAELLYYFLKYLKEGSQPLYPRRPL